MANNPRRPTHIEVSTPAPGDGEEISEARAKQGLRGRHVVMILTVSLVLVVAAFVGAFLANGRPSFGQRETANATSAQMFNAPEPPPPMSRPRS
jgi:hypothetical protein